jgi:hypothetical protein
VKPAKGQAAATATDPLQGWKARQCEAVVKDGVLTITSNGKSGAFLGHGTGKMTGPAVLKLRVRSIAGGAGKVESYPASAADATNMKSVPFQVPAGDWQELSVELAEKGPLGTLRLYLPTDANPVELRWVELRGKGSGASQRWDFSAP